MLDFSGVVSSESSFVGAVDAKPSRPQPAPQSERESWSATERVGFRFAFVLAALYLVVNFLPELLWRLPFTEKLGQLWFAKVISAYWQPSMRWLTNNVLHIATAPYVDETPALPFNIVVGMGVITIVAAVLTIVWSYADRRRHHYRTLHEWFRVYLRFSVATILIHYGMIKLMLDQFGASVLPSELVTPVGSLGLFRMLSVFMAASPIYQFFAGATEMLAGILLVFRRTSRVGAWAAIAAMTNVVVLNWAYHFTMYVMSAGILIMAILLAVPDLPRLFNLLVLERPVSAAERRPLFTTAVFARAGRVPGVMFLVVATAHEFMDAKSNGHLRPQGPVYGAYEVESFARNGSTVPPLLTDEALWRRFAVDPTRGRSLNANGTLMFAHDTVRFTIRADTVAKTLTLTPFRAPKQTSVWNYSTPDANHLVLAGTRELHRIAPGASQTAADSIRVTLRRIELDELLLIRSQPWFR